jgi:hypothetical protein
MAWKIRPSARLQTCRVCEHENELPYVFCEECGAPRVKLGRWRVTFHLSVAMTAFVGAYYYKDHIIWPWPLFAFYALLATEFAASLIKGSWRLSARLYLWFLIFFGAFGAAFQIHHAEGSGVFFLAVTAMPDFAREEPGIFYSIVGIIAALIFVPAYLRWSRVYGWVNSYRLVLLAGMVISLVVLAAFRAVVWIHANDLFPSISSQIEGFVLTTVPEQGRYVNFAAFTMLRVFMFEVFLVSAIRGYALARRTRRAEDKAALVDVSGFTRSLFGIANVMRQLGHAIENMVLYLVSTFKTLAVDMAIILGVFTRELLVPTIALLGAGSLTYVLTLATVGYVERNDWQFVATIMACVAAILLCVLLFLGCKTRCTWRRIFQFYAQLIGWLLPNLLVFFLLLSFSLWASSKALNSLDDDLVMPYRMGMLTQVIAALLALLVAIVFIRKRSVLTATVDQGAVIDDNATPFDDDEDETEEGDDQDEDDDLPPLEQEEEEHEDEEIKVGLWGRARHAVRSLRVDEHTRKALGRAKGLQERLHGKPRAVDDFLRFTQEIRDRETKIRALDTNRIHVSAATYESLRKRYTDELTDFQDQRGRAEKEIAQLRERNVIERGEIEAKIADLKEQRAEFDRLRQAGALSQAEHRKRAAQIKIMLESEALRLKAAQRQQRFLTLDDVDEKPAGQSESTTPTGEH